jgi:hypothetical protein
LLHIILVSVIPVGRHSGGLYSMDAFPGGRNSRWALFRLSHRIYPLSSWHFLNITNVVFESNCYVMGYVIHMSHYYSFYFTVRHFCNLTVESTLFLHGAA